MSLKMALSMFLWGLSDLEVHQFTGISVNQLGLNCPFQVTITWLTVWSHLQDAIRGCTNCCTGHWIWRKGSHCCASSSLSFPCS
ncbi:hypothetical protein EDB92DRAFT_1827177 [Lactarius akahatsu]|uniref:Secreted protein n=1 Tax=Lactarius akahatsu TaxID=416441 RepID=A0AAD4LT73_9AGAM|nr:hypothetical protein EDB92DRAFT_1827177 [Lactarius akahatsu]